jgi:hypothetical protein
MQCALFLATGRSAYLAHLLVIDVHCVRRAYLREVVYEVVN